MVARTSLAVALACLASSPYAVTGKMMIGQEQAVATDAQTAAAAVEAAAKKPEDDHSITTKEAKRIKYAKSAKDHLITDLPGLPSSYTHKMYSGHLPVWEKTLQNDGSLFYWLAESQGNPDQDPLLIWLNGGPGCSSMDGFFVENGPFSVNAGGFSLKTNPWSWNKNANVLYVDQPVGTGLSLAVNESYAQSQEDVNTMFGTFLHNWLELYPHFAHRELFFSGESYAGRYIPSFAHALVEGEGAFAGLPLHPSGLLIGNGWTHPLIQTQTYPEFAYNSGLIGWQQRHYLEKLSVNCGLAMQNNTAANPSPIKRVSGQGDKKQKQQQRNKPQHKPAKRPVDVASGGKDPLKHGRIHSAPLAVPECQEIFNSLLLASGSQDTGLVNVYDVRLYDQTAGDAWPPQGVSVKYYLNRPEVRHALHAYPDVLATPWEECNGPVNRWLGQENMIATRPHLAAVMQRGVRVLIYNGQFDLICNHVGTEAYLSTMDSWPELDHWLSARRAVWNVDGEIAGYVKAAKELTFLLVLGGSHMVPMDKPSQSFDMVDRFLRKKSYADDPTEIEIPYTPTVPLIPGDAVPDDADPSSWSSEETGETNSPTAAESTFSAAAINAAPAAASTSAASEGSGSGAFAWVLGGSALAALALTAVSQARKRRADGYRDIPHME